jgi:hypothetical protein
MSELIISIRRDKVRPPKFGRKEALVSASFTNGCRWEKQSDLMVTCRIAYVLALILNIHISPVQVVQLLMLLGAGSTYAGGH